ncbi:MAG: hypothetical protein AAGA87_07185 [Pseudomonadota bacterium]
MDPTFLFLRTLDLIAISTLPFIILALSGRRFFMSHSFNRILYAIVIVNALCAIVAVSRLGDGDRVLDLLARAMAYGCVPLWLVVTDVCRSTGSSDRYGDGWATVYRKREARPVVAPDPEPELEDLPWASPPVSPARPVARYTPSGPAAATIAVRGTA